MISYDLAAGQLVLQDGIKQYVLALTSATAVSPFASAEGALPTRPDRSPEELAREIARRQDLQDAFVALALARQEHEKQEQPPANTRPATQVLQPRLLDNEI